MDYINVIEDGAILTGTTTDLIIDLDKQEKAIKKSKRGSMERTQGRDGEERHQED